MICLRSLVIGILFFQVLPLSFPAEAEPPKLKVVYNTGVAPLKFEDESGRPAGMFPDLWELWAAKAGRDIEFVRADSFADSLGLLRNGKADLHAGLFKTEEREKFLDYSEPILKLDYYIFTHPSVRQVKSAGETEGLVVGIQKGGFTEKWVRSKIPSERIKVYDSFTQLFRAARTGEVRVFIATEISLFYYLAQNRLANIFAFDRENPLYSQVYHTATAKGNPALVESVNMGLAGVTPLERKRLDDKWIASNARKIPAEFAALLTEELSFLSKTVSIKVHNENDRAPYNYNENGSPKGHSVDYMSLLAERTGLEVQFLNHPSRDEFLSMMKSGELDVMMNIAKTPERETYLEYTPPYATVDQTLFTRRDFPAVSSVKDLSGKTIAVPRGFYIRYVLGRYPEVGIMDVEDMTEALFAVSNGRAHGIIKPKQVVIHLAGELGIGNLKPHPEFDIPEEGSGSSSFPTHGETCLRNAGKKRSICCIRSSK